MSEAQRPREAFEARQAKWLAPCAIRERDCGGRGAAEEDHPYRTCFQRDRDRIIHCTAFRRLDFKTQVFVPHEHDHFRTRMTHTLEVAQIGRDLARALRLNEDLVEAAALAHDLGHPPFGHGGEASLDELMADHGRFEHNRQSLRVVDYLECPYPSLRGLNLTRVVRECLAKHRSRYDQPTNEEFDPAQSLPLEGQIVDLADEIAYTSADLEDALACGWISPIGLDGLELWSRAWRLAGAGGTDAEQSRRIVPACKATLAIMADDAVAFTRAAIEQKGLDSPDAVRSLGERCVGFSPGLAAAVRQVQDFLNKNVYFHPQNVAKSDEGRKIIRDLFGAYVADPRQMPQGCRERIPRDGLHRAVCDYIAGMTDQFCKQQHARLCR